MTIENQNDVEALRRVGRAVALVLREMLEALTPGMSTAELDALGRERLAALGARSAPRLDYDFPGETCISINEEAAHGIPGGRRLRRGDVVNVDVSAEMDGYYADTGGTRVLDPVPARLRRLCHATRTALDEALAQARAGVPINRIGAAIEGAARRYRFKVIRNLGSHGVGRKLHEFPGSIPGYYEPRDRRVLHEGMVITIEPFLSTRSERALPTGDGWTLAGEPGNRSAQYEHTLIVTRDAPIVVTNAA